eukprot:1550669-Rhodomonas_salina.2
MVGIPRCHGFAMQTAAVPLHEVETLVSPVSSAPRGLSQAEAALCRLFGLGLLAVSQPLESEDAEQPAA